MDAESIKIIGQIVLLVVLIVLGFMAELNDKESEGYFLAALCIFIWFVS